MIESILNEMTIEEKVGQLVQIAGVYFLPSAQITGPLAEMKPKEDDIYAVGSVLGLHEAKEIREVQELFLQRSRLKIPLMFMFDVVHGYKTIFPVPLAQACSWNEALVEQAARVGALEASVSGIHVTFSPMVDVVRDPRWGRVMESFGEDPLLNSVLGKAMIRGYQGNSLAKKASVGACLKHFVAYGLSESGRDYNTVDVSVWQLFNTYLKSFQEGIKVGAAMVMTSFNLVNGIPMTVNKKMLKNVLREQMKFQGVLISDWGSLWESYTHGAIEDSKEGAQKAIEATLDIEMMSNCYFDALVDIVKAGEVPASIVNDSARRVLQLKESLGLFDNPFKNANEELEKEFHFCSEHLELSYRLSCESIVLLKNNQDTLPLSSSTSVCFDGPLADSRDLLGNWCGIGEKEDCCTVLEVAKQRGLTLSPTAQTVVYVLGEGSDESGEAHSKAHLDISSKDIEKIKAYKKAGLTVISILLSGRPLLLQPLLEDCDAMLHAYHLGSQSAEALVDTLLGLNNPSAKSAMTYPRSTGQIPIYYNHQNTGRPDSLQYETSEHFYSHYDDEENTPLIPFGFGLSYSHFVAYDYKMLQDEKDFVFSATIENKSSLDGKEVVPIYFRDFSAKVSRPIKELVAFKKVFIPAKKTVSVELRIEMQALGYYDDEAVYQPALGKIGFYTSLDQTQAQKFLFHI